MNQEVRALDWNDTITADPKRYITLTPGEYDFTVINLEKGRYEGGENLPVCPKATVKIEIETLEGSAIIHVNLFLTTKTEHQLAAFFNSIGLKREGEPLVMNWGQVLGKSGRCKIGNRTYNDKTYNDVKEWLPPRNYTAPVQTWQPPKQQY